MSFFQNGKRKTKQGKIFKENKNKSGVRISGNHFGWLYLNLLPGCSVVAGSVAKYSRALCIAGGIGGGVGKWSPCGWKPKALEKCKKAWVE